MFIVITKKKMKTALMAILATVLLIASLVEFESWSTLVYECFIPEPMGAEVPIIMYHLITENAKYQGKYGVSPREMENDLKYLKENGYETILISDLIEFVANKRPLPEKPIILTFDDGNNSDYDFLYPLLKKYEMKAILSIVGKFTDDSSNNGHLTWEQVIEMYAADVAEIQNHSYDLHERPIGGGKKDSESMEEYKKRFCEDLSKMQEQIEENIGFTPTTFAYPLGVISKGSKEALQEMGFQASLSSWEGINIIRQNEPDCLFKLRRNNRPHGVSIAEVLEEMENQK